MDLSLCLDIMKFTGPPICKYWSYHRKLKEYSNNLSSQKDDLLSRKESIELRLHNERQVGKIIDKEVENWLKKVERIIGEIKSLEYEVSKVRYLSRASLGKQIYKKIEETNKVYEQGNFSHALVIDAPSNSGMHLPTVPEFLGETIVTEEIWECLMGDGVCKIGVCGMGGIGKTTIMKRIHNELLSEPKFDKIIWATVSQEFNVFKLQKDIASSFNEDLSRYEDNTKRAAMLSKFLATKRHVLILDDVWKRFFLDDVGISEPTRSNGCKLLLTTRSIEVARSMCCKEITVMPLSEGDALNLFLKHSGHDLHYVPTLESTLKQVVKQCAGLPLAIVTIGSSMRGENDAHVWKFALNKLKKHAARVESMAKDVFEPLKFSYDRLSNMKLKQCFLYCALYPEDYEISKKELIEYWIVEGLIDEMETRQEMYEEGHDTLKRLENNCLLEKTNKEGRVKMHDLVRDLALHITNENPRYLVKAGMQMEELPYEQEWKEDLEKVSLMQNEIKEIPSNVALIPKCKTLSTLLLQHNSKLKRIDESFFMLMTRLKILDLSYNDCIRALPNSVSELENLNALLLHGCWTLEYVPSLLKLRGLKKLDLGGTVIEELPHGMEMLVRLTYLDLNTWSLEQVPSGILPKLARLQHLRLDGKPDLVCPIEEVAALRKLEFLRIRFSNLQDYHLYLSSRLHQGFLNSYMFIVGYSLLGGLSGTNGYGKSVVFDDLDISGHSLLLPTNIQELKIFHCHDLRNLSDHDISATDLRRCYIIDCQGLECLVSSSFCYLILQSIETLILKYLKNLQVLFRGERDIATPTPAPPGTFSHLKYFEIENCPKIKKLFWPDLMHNLQNLEKLRVSFCQQLVEIIGALDEQGRQSIVFALPQLRKMTLEHLPELECICRGGSQMECNYLEEFQIYECPKLKRVPILLPQLENGQLLPPFFLRVIKAFPKEWWDSLEWDHPGIQNVLQPYVKHIPSGV